MDFLRLTHIKDTHFPQAWELYKRAFPYVERRDLDLQKKILKDPKYHFNIISRDTEFVGIILWWQFAGLQYIEHFTIMENLRCQGLGQDILGDYISSAQDPIILEVEPPADTLNKRRIMFYKRLGFSLNPYDYTQYPMRKNGDPIPLLLMSYPESLSNTEFITFKKNIKDICYTPYVGKE